MSTFLGRWSRPGRRPNHLDLHALECRCLPAVFVVNALTDTGTGSGLAGDLRYCVSQANANAVADTITFDSTLFARPQAILLPNGYLNISQDVTIDGPGASLLTIRNLKVNNPVLQIRNSTSTINVTMRNLTVTGGNVTFDGGGIYVDDEIVTLIGLTVTENRAGSRGGGIYVSGGSLTQPANGMLTINACEISFNEAAQGGGLSHRTKGPVTVLNSVITGNRVVVTNGSGGGIYQNYPGSLTIQACTISNNAAPRGGGISSRPSTGTNSISISESSIEGNYANGQGGGIYIAGGSSATINQSTIVANVSAASIGGGLHFTGSGTSVLTHVTISGNRAVLGSGGGIGCELFTGAVTVRNSTLTANSAALNAGGIHHNGSTGTITLQSSVVAQNFNATSKLQFDVSASSAKVFPGNKNLIGVGDVGNVTISGTNIQGTQKTPIDARLGALANNGGTTRTHLPALNSPVRNAGQDFSGSSFDQRGSGFPRTLESITDIGAIESDGRLPVAQTMIRPPIVAAGAGSDTIELTFVDAVAIDVASIDVNDIAIVDPLGNKLTVTKATVDMNSNGTPRKVVYEFAVPGGAWTVAANGVYTVAIVANQVLDAETPANSALAGPIGQFTVAIPTTYVVDEATDVDDGNFGPGHLSLREALRLANNQPRGSRDVIDFASAVFTVGTTIALNNQALPITDSVVINGPGADRLIIDGKNSSRILRIDIANSSGQTVEVNQLTITGGNSASAPGGGIFMNDEVVTLAKVVVTNNTTVHDGGGINVHGLSGQLSIIDSRMDNNTTTGGSRAGGAINFENFAIDPTSLRFSLLRSSISNNSATGDGGGIYFYWHGTLQVESSTISGNKAGSGSGGGVYFFGDLGTGSFIRNSTVSGNSANTGGGLFLRSLKGQLDVQNATITNNSASARGGGMAGESANKGLLTLHSTIVAANAAPSGPDLSFDLQQNIPGNNNLIGVGNSGGFQLTGSNNPLLIGTLTLPVNPGLSPLSDNGGPTRTHALLANSPAINAGTNLAGLPYDQRGIGFSRVIGIAADAGAVEFQNLPAVVTSVQIGDGSTQRSIVRSLTVTFDRPLTPTANSFALKRSVDNSIVALSVSAVVGNSVILTFASGPVENGSLADGRYTLTAIAAQLNNGAFDGNGDTIPGDDYVLVGTPGNGLFRLFGDANGDGAVTAADFNAFRLAYGSTGPSIFDFDGDNQVRASDLYAFRLRYGVTI